MAGCARRPVELPRSWDQSAFLAAAHYGVSTQVIRSAMLILRAEGLVEGHQGRGVYVRERGNSP
ncbi:GntR family transcriptional regulator [Micromonospora sp. H33]|uniref:GntR family transcriptional regulator n=1 Tax=Micromonospora sp. H33 TaxID=3452215 RepID=UPI003F89A139